MATRSIEVHILGFDDDIYGRSMTHAIFIIISETGIEISFGGRFGRTNAERCRTMSGAAQK
jgi:hypothetical protein